MARIMAGTATVSNAGTRVQLSNTKDRVLSLFILAQPDNAGNLYFGDSAVAANAGVTLPVGKPFSVDIAKAEKDGSVVFDKFYVDSATNGDKLDWFAVVA